MPLDLVAMKRKDLPAGMPVKQASLTAAMHAEWMTAASAMNLVQTQRLRDYYSDVSFLGDARRALLSEMQLLVESEDSSKELREHVLEVREVLRYAIDHDLAFAALAD